MTTNTQSTQQDVDRLAEAGERVYEEKIKAQVEPRLTGKYLAIEPDSGEYFVGETMGEAGERAREKYPQKRFHLKKVGFRAAVHIHGFRGLFAV